MMVFLSTFGIALVLRILSVDAEEVNFNRCKRIETFGYKYDSLFKLEPKPDVLAEVHFYVKAVSDAHVLFTLNPDILDSLSAFRSKSPVIEIVIGGGRNSFSSIRMGTMNNKFTKVQVNTKDILSPSEYRGFWVRIASSRMGTVSVGYENDTNPFMSEVLGGDSTSLQYFGVSSWNKVKASWRFDCEAGESTETADLEETIANLSSMQKLRRDIIMFLDPSMPPDPIGDAEEVPVNLALQVHHINLDEVKNYIDMGGKMHLSWNDSKLSWDPKLYGNITSLVVPSTEIWTPSISVLASRFDQLPLLEEVGISTGAVVNYHGSVLWTPAFNLYAFAILLTLENWPQDQYSFTIGLDYEASSSTSTNIRLVADLARWQILEQRSLWKAIDITTEFDYQNETYSWLPVLMVGFDLTRQSHGYLEIYATPFFGIAIMSLASFWLELHHNSRLYIHCASLIISSLYIVTIAERIPVHTAKVPVILSVYTTSLFLSTLSIIIYLSLKQLRRCTWAIPQFIRQLLTAPSVECCLFLRGIEDREGETKDWVMISAAIERVQFLIYLAFTVTMVIGVLHK